MQRPQGYHQYAPPVFIQELDGTPVGPPAGPPPPYHYPPPSPTPSHPGYEAGLVEESGTCVALSSHPVKLEPQFPASPSSATHQTEPPWEGGEDGKPAKPKPSFNERMYQWSNKAAGPINKLTNKLGCEAWWPTTLDKECDKCARILKNFVLDGYYTDDPSSPAPSPGDPLHPGPKPSKHAPPPTVSAADPSRKKSNQRSLVRIPPEAIASARGLAIFTTFRTGGAHVGGTGGSGVVLARLPDGSWSPPSGILPNSVSVGLMLGLDVYDCVFVLNAPEAVEGFMRRARFSLGGDMSVVAGPASAGAVVEADLRDMARAPVWSYIKSRGFWAGVQVDGTIIVARPDANAAFYGEKGILPEQILRGQVRSHEPGRLADDGSRMWPDGAARLMAVVCEAGGGKADPAILAEIGRRPTTPTPTPGDAAGWDSEGGYMGAAGGAGEGSAGGEKPEKPKPKKWFGFW
ncbi:hypothetical protein SLS62_007005 [Diatrype stigma]|uniref:Ysc84 actin-binding domain-containing protein n=1 Tax=Diatrype stigma TaxID=117547 RepID=A0AAN9UME5_9PEZI